MPKKVAIIDMSVAIEGIGTVIALTKENLWSIPSSERIHRRERIQIRTPAGRTISTFIKGIEMINRGSEKWSVSLSLPGSVAPEDIPIGSELWLERDGSDPVIEP